MDHPIMLMHERNISHANIEQEVSLFDRGESPGRKVRDNTHPSHVGWQSQQWGDPIVVIIGQLPYMPQ